MFTFIVDIGARVFVACLVVHNELIVHKIKAVAFRFIWILNHFFNECIVQLRNIVQHIPIVGACWYTKIEQFVHALYQLISKIMPLDHSKVVYSLISNLECQPLCDD